MFERREINIDAGLLSSFVLFGVVRTSFGTGDEAPETITLTGTVRDFRERTDPSGHPDFEAVPSHGFGVYAGNIDPRLGADGKPVFTGSGRKVAEPGRDAAGRPIAMHLCNRRFVAMDAAWASECDILEDSTGTDAYEVCLVDAAFNDDGTSAWTYHVRELGTGKDLSHWNLRLDPAHEVLDGTTSGYEFGVDGSTGYFGIKWDVDDDFTEGDFTIVLDGHYAGAYDGTGVLAKGGSDHDLGRGYVPTGTVSTNGSPYPMDDTLVEDAGLGDATGTVSYSSTGGITSSETFDQWYRDVLGENLSKPLDLTFVRQDDGSYVFDDTHDPTYAALGGFFPIESTLFGNPGGSPDRNFHFTFELHTEFTYQADGDQIFKFIGDDDVWVFIDGKLAIDLGGVHGETEQFVDLDRMGLTDGETYTLDFFFAERHRTQSNFRIETNLVLAESDDVSKMMTLAFD